MRVNSIDGVISMLKYVGTGSEVTREIWEMKLLTLLPRLELGSSGSSANRVIWKPCFARVCDTCGFGRWLQSLFSTLLQLVVRSQSLCCLWFACLSTFLSNWCSAAVSANPWNVVHFVLWVTATQFLFFFLRTCSFQLENCSVSLLACWQDFPCSLHRLWGFLGCVHRRFPSPVILQCSEFLVDSFEDQVGLGLSPCLMDKYLWEHIQIFLSLDDLLCLREVARFHATCEWFGPGWTVVLSPLVHVVRRPAWDQSQDLPRFRWGADTLPCAHGCWMSGSWCAACFASITGGLRNFPFSAWLKLASGCSVTSMIFVRFVRSVVSQCACVSDVCNDHVRVLWFTSTMFCSFFSLLPSQ